MVPRVFCFLFATSSVGLCISAGCGTGDDEQPLFRLPHIVNGEKVSSYEYPKVGETSWGCTGTVIHKNLVLTSAHCDLRDGDAFTVREQRVLTNGQVLHLLRQAFVIEGGVRRPSCYRAKDESTKCDLALLIVDTPRSTAGRGFHSIPTSTLATLATTAAYKGRPVKLVGYGVIDKEGTNPSVSGNFIYETHNKISFINEDPRPNGDDKWFRGSFGWKKREGQGNICKGDSGGPAFWQENGKWVVAGVHSRIATSSSRTHICYEYGAAAKVTPHRPWIDSVIQSMSCELEPCAEEQTCIETVTGHQCQDPDQVPDEDGVELSTFVWIPYFLAD